MPGTPIRSVLVTSCLFFFLVYNGKLFSQCGTPLTTGSTTITTAGTIINTYYPGTGNPTSGSFIVTVGTKDPKGATTAIALNDLILIIQMQGADINAANSVAYGGSNGSAPASGYTNNSTMVAGLYEYANVASVSGSSITLTYPLSNNYYTRTFTSANSIQSFQVIRVPRYYDLTINNNKSITAAPWNGATGGVVVLEAADKLKISGSVTVNGLGFRGGGGKQMVGATSGNSNGSGIIGTTDYRWNSPLTNAANTTGGAKGEGIAGSPAYYYTTGATTTSTALVEGYINGSLGRGAPGNAGGGGTDGDPEDNPSGNQYNSGGGGGSNAGSGGQGGSGWPGTTGDITTFPTGGYGGSAFAQASLQRVIMGGGGGAGTANNSSSSNESNCSGGVGGGIIIARAKTYAGNGSLDAGGANAPGVTTTYASAQTDAAGGGGAGGSIIIVTSAAGATGLGTIDVSATGGNGGDMTTYYNHGPGGGGGGGVIYTNGTLSSATLTGGSNGLTRSGSSTGTINNAYGAAPGNDGLLVTLPGTPVFSSSSSSTSPCGVLPILLTNFTAVLNNKNVLLKWSAENAINFDNFSVERSTDGADFSGIGVVDYVSGLSTYQLVDINPQPGQNFYRLKMVDKDGRYVYSPVLSIRLDETANDRFLMYPNPAFAEVILQFNSTASHQVAVEIFDNNGKKLIYKDYTAAPGQNYIAVPEIKNLPYGLYLVNLSTNAGILTEKLMVGKKN